MEEGRKEDGWREGRVERRKDGEKEDGERKGSRNGRMERGKKRNKDKSGRLRLQKYERTRAQSDVDISSAPVRMGGSAALPAKGGRSPGGWRRSVA